MENKGFIGIQLNESEGNLVADNKILVSTEDGIGIQLNKSKNNDILRNEILSSTQIEFLNNLNETVTTLNSKTSDREIKDLLKTIEDQINEVKNSKQETLLDKAHKLSETVSNVVTLGSEKLPALAVLLTPYILQIGQIFLPISA